MRLTVCCLATLLISAAAVAEESDTEKGFVPLFDGKTLSGWEGAANVFRVEQGAVVAGSLESKIPRNEFLCTKREFADFELRLKAKLLGAGDNAGIQFRSKRIPNHHEVEGYQCDMGSAFGRNIWGALYDESRRRRMLAEGDAAKVESVVRAGDWNEFVIRCEGKHIQIWLNGLQTVDYLESEDVAKSGVIGLQIHGGDPAEARYKKIRLKRLAKN